VLDLNLPKHDGFEVLQAIRNAKRLANVPVMVASSLPSRPDTVQFGIAHYVCKPSDLDQFLQLGVGLKHLLLGGKRKRWVLAHFV
jgi:DNA-binding response OmpR family regulator